MADTAKYGEVMTIEFDHGIKDGHIKKINELIAQGWEVADAKIIQLSNPPRPNPPGNSNWFQNEWYCFILGKPRR